MLFPNDPSVGQVHVENKRYKEKINEGHADGPNSDRHLWKWFRQMGRVVWHGRGLWRPTSHEDLVQAHNVCLVSEDGPCYEITWASV